MDISTGMEHPSAARLDNRDSSAEARLQRGTAPRRQENQRMGGHMSARKLIRDRTDAERERYPADAETKMHVFKYETPAPAPRPKQLAWLVKGELQQVVVQVVKDGGENNLH